MGQTCPIPTLIRSCPFIVETPLLASPLAYSRHVDTSVYVSPAIELSKSTSIIHIVIAAHLPSCRDRVVCGPHQFDRHAATLSSKCYFLLVIVLILSKHNAVIVMIKKVCEQGRRSKSTWHICKDIEIVETYKAG